ncbi:MAG: B12-binding domain-containing protein [Candidatus Brocadiia bacterium]
MSDAQPLAQALGQLKEDEAKAILQQQLGAGVPAAQILEACQAGLAEVGRRFEKGEYFISELMYAGEVMKDIMAQLQPHLEEARQETPAAGTVVLGTVKGDIHDIGKDVVALMLRGSGFRVVDLGVDVSPQQFAEAAEAHQAFAVGMSVFLTTCCPAVDQTVEALREAGLRDRLHVMIGGAAASDFVAQRTGCDTYGDTAVDAVRLATAAAGQG